jgi:hypothetical protein
LTNCVCLCLALQSDNGTDTLEQLKLMHAAALGPEALVCVDVTADSAFARAPAVEIPEPPPLPEPEIGAKNAPLLRHFIKC